MPKTLFTESLSDLSLEHRPSSVRGGAMKPNRYT
jgi:hypothetical protein